MKGFDKFSKSQQNEIIKLNKLNKRVIAKSQVVFEVPEKGLVVESVVYDKSNDRFFISSVYNRNIYQFANGKLTKFTNDPNLWAMHSLRIYNNELWASTSSIEQMRGAEQDKIGPSGIIRFNLNSGAELSRHILDDGEAHIFGDFILANDEVYVSDSKQNHIYKLDMETNDFQQITPDTFFVSLQGLVRYGDHLVIADYSFGLFNLNLNTFKINPDTSCGAYRFTRNRWSL